MIKVCLHLASALALLSSISLIAHSQEAPFATSDGAKEVRFDFIEPGFTVHELPVRVTNLNNIEYTADGRLYAAGYDGRIHTLIDSDGDGLEDTAKVFFDGKGDYDTPMGMVIANDSVYLTLRRRIERFVDTDGDGVSDKNEVVASGWFDEDTTKDKTFLHRRVDDSLSLAMDKDGNFYTALGTPNYRDLYQLGDDETSKYRQDRYRGAVVKIAPGGKPQVIATGVRFIIGMQFNKNGDLFGTDQEGATWGPGNPFDELLHIRRGVHYGFPPRHPKHLPNVIDEPSVVDFAPQHQSTCGFRFDEERSGFKRFGPPTWEGNAIVTGESRGKIWRVPLVKTSSGYVGKQVLIAATNLMPIDVTISPKGELLVCCHSGKPDWGTGPKGEGRLFKIVYSSQNAAAVAAVWPESLTQIRLALDKPLPQDSKFDVAIAGGRYVRAGDELETFRPGYEVVLKEQAGAPKHHPKIKSVVIDKLGRNITIVTSPHAWTDNYALKLKWNSSSLSQQGFFYSDYSFDGVKARWTKAGESTPTWQGWLPSVNLRAAQAWTVGSTDHEELFKLLRSNGTLLLNGVLRPDTQPRTLKVEGANPAKLTAAESDNSISPDESIPTGKPYPFNIEWSTSNDIELDASLTIKRIFENSDGVAVQSIAASNHSVLIPDAPSLEAPGAPANFKPTSDFVAGDAAKGAEVFKASCAVCHAFRGTGSKVGPDLSNSPTRNPAAIQEDVINPNATLNPDYLTYGIELTNGSVIVGTLSSDRPNHFQIQQADGKLVEVDEGEIETIRQMPNSLMPVGLKETLGEEKLRDLITYLTNKAQ